MSINVVIADDHTVVREGIRAIVESKTKDIKVVGEASNGWEVLKMTRNTPADVYILDVSMPILNGIETTNKLVKKDPKKKIIILSIHDSRAFVEKALKSGAKGYVLKGSATEEIVYAIRHVYNEGFFLSPQISKVMVQKFLNKGNNHKPREKTTELTSKEREILQLITEGFSNKEIARQLRLSSNTVHVHRNNIMRKLDIHKQADLIRYGLKEGISQL
jgi:two-component system response regulator NreC